MKNISFSMVVMLLALSIHSSAQLNYLFSAGSRPYVPVTGGIAPHLISDYVKWEVEDEGLARIPIGFTFNYDHKDYTQANVSVNGFITFGTFFSTAWNFRYFNNNLARGPIAWGYQRSVIAPFWDDLLLPDTLSLVYKTTGRAPNRVFTIEWKKVKWVYESLAPVLSIELKLYETSNIIEFQYKDEGSLPDPRYAFASIGITSAYCNRDFISLQNTSSHPTISLIKANDSLTVKPANNQVYTFTPAKPDIPESFEKLLKYTHNSVSFNIRTKGDKHHDNGDNHHDNGDNHNEHGNNGFEYAVTTSPIPPAFGKKTESGNVTVSSLLPATTYYIYARSRIDDHKYSQWECDVFTTAIKPVALPYTASLDGVNFPPYLPTDMRQQDFQDTSLYYDAGNGWVGVQDLFTPGNNFYYDQTWYFNADVWMFTPGINLREGKTYQLKFGYLSLFQNSPSDVSSLEVKYGMGTGEAAMTSGILFKKSDIGGFDLYGDWSTFIPEEIVIEFKPHSSGAYYFGFHNLSPFMQGLLVLNNISVTEKVHSSHAPLALVGNTNNSDNVLNWSIENNAKAGGFEIERSTDGINFTKIGDVPAQELKSSNDSKTRASYRSPQNQIISASASSNDKYSVAFDKTRPGFELKTSDDGMNFKKKDVSSAKSRMNTDDKINSYTDRNAAGICYYRLKQAGQNGNVIFSNVVMLQNKAIGNVPTVTIYPNPVKDILNVELGKTNTAKMRIVVVDTYGKTVINKVVEQSDNEGTNHIQLSTSDLPAGVYILRLTNGSETTTTRFVKQR